MVRGQLGLSTTKSYSLQATYPYWQFALIIFQAYCPKHSKKRDRHGSESESDSPRKSNGTPVKEARMSEEEMATLRAERYIQLLASFLWEMK